MRYFIGTYSLNCLVDHDLFALELQRSINGNLLSIFARVVER